MIKYKVKTGCKVLNQKARIKINNGYKPLLKGMHCKKCDQDTLIEFVESDLTHVKSIYTFCCPYFKERMLKKLNW